MYGVFTSVNFPMYKPLRFDAPFWLATIIALVAAGAIGCFGVAAASGFAVAASPDALTTGN